MHHFDADTYRGTPSFQKKYVPTYEVIICNLDVRTS
jgi:hypothetical protein